MTPWCQGLGVGRECCCPLWLWPSRGPGGHLQVQITFRDSLADTGLLETLDNSPGCCHQAQILLLPQMAVGRTRVPCPCLTLGSRDGSQMWQFCHCLRATLKNTLFWWLFPWQLTNDAIQPPLTTPAWECPVPVLRIDASVK